MNDLGNTVIENFNTFPPSNTWLDWIKILAMPIATVVVGFLVFLYTNSHHKRTMLNSLDSKSEWRKKLFEVASSSSIGMQEVYTLRTSVRFDCKDLPETIFEKKTNEIIKFCDCVTSSHSNINESLPFLEQEMTRIYCRYLLANQWEILQLTFIKRKFYKLQMGKWYKKEKELDEKTNELINKLTP